MMGAEAIWTRLREHRFTAAGLLVLLGAIILLLPFQVEPSWYPPALRVLHLGLPSLAVFAAFALLAWMPSTGRLALAIGALAYLAVAVVLAVADVAYVGTVMRGGLSLVALLIWPTLVLMHAGRWLGWVPLPE